MIEEVFFNYRELNYYIEKYDDEKSTRALAYAIWEKYANENNWSWRKKINKFKEIKKLLKENC